MAFLQANPGKDIEIVSLRLDGGWSGRAVLFAVSRGKKLLKLDWLDCLAEPQWLFQDIEKTLKTEDRNCVVVKDLSIGRSRQKVVIKRHYPGGGLRQFLRSFRPGSRAQRNFDAALKLLSCGISVAAPLAELQKRRYLRVEQSIYITEFLEASSNLHTFLSEKLSAKRKERFAVKKQLGRQLAEILAELHKNKLWYRDSKATNFVVCKETGGGHKVLLTDMDGIKPYFLRRGRCRYRSLWQLAASVFSIPAVNRTDYLRCFNAYCDLTGIERSRRHNIFRELIRKAEAKRRRSVPKNILLIKPSSLGDIVMALPALSALRRSFPDAKISWFVRTEFAPLIRNHPDLNEVILFDRAFLGKCWYHPRAFAALVSLILQLRRGKFDAVLDLQGLFRTASLGWLSGCRKRLGMAGAREFAHIFYTHKVKQDEDCIHLVDYYLKIVRAAGASETDVRFVLPIDFTPAYAVSRLLKANGVNADNYACFVPTSAHADKCWPVERFAELADRVSKEFKLSIAATGAAAEKDTVEKLKSKAFVPVANLAGETSIKELMVLLKSAKLVVSNDTGPGHIAAALGVPVVLLFGRSNPARVAPYGRKNSVAAVEPDGRGFKADSADPKHNIKNVTVDEVFQKVCEQLNRC